MRSLYGCCLAILVFILGCSSAETPAEVSGTVMINGKPLSEGEIIFEDAKNNKTPGAGLIKEGKYSILVIPGPKKVKILASRPTSKPDPVMGSAAKESILGPEFNDKTTLTADVQPGKNKDVNFQVQEWLRNSP